MSLTVLSVLWQGEFRIRRYNPDWVRRMRNMVSRHLGSHRFVCLSNVDISGVETIPLWHDWPGWWSKIELFREDFDDRMMFIDLDSLITGNLEDIAEYPSHFATAPSSQWWQTESTGGFNSSTMVWSAGHGRQIYERFHSDLMGDFRGDQDYMQTVMDNDHLPSEWFCKLRYCTEGPPEDVKILACMPWKNDLASEKFEWVDELWR